MYIYLRIPRIKKTHPGKSVIILRIPRIKNTHPGKWVIIQTVEIGTVT